jgi:GTP-binding protein
VTTREANRILHAAWERKPPPGGGRRATKLYYAVQVRGGPPAFALFTNLTKEPHFSYRRYIENTLRHNLGLDGVPIRVIIRGRQH